MKNISLLFISLLVVSSGVFTSCKDSTKNENATSEETAKTETLCFKNEYKFQDSTDNLDVLELTLMIEGENVTGEYNWLPALKDQRNGTLTGTLDNNTIKAVYKYQQEGIEASAPITIKLFDDKASLQTDDANLGLDTEVAKVSCN